MKRFLHICLLAGVLTLAAIVIGGCSASPSNREPRNDKASDPDLPDIAKPEKTKEQFDERLIGTLKKKEISGVFTLRPTTGVLDVHNLYVQGPNKTIALRCISDWSSGGFWEGRVRADEEVVQLKLEPGRKLTSTTDLDETNLRIDKIGCILDAQPLEDPLFLDMTTKKQRPQIFLGRGSGVIFRLVFNAKKGLEGKPVLFVSQVPQSLPNGDPKPVKALRVAAISCEHILGDKSRGSATGSVVIRGKAARIKLGATASSKVLNGDNKEPARLGGLWCGYELPKDKKHPRPRMVPIRMESAR